MTPGASGLCVQRSDAPLSPPRRNPVLNAIVFETDRPKGDCLGADADGGDVQALDLAAFRAALVFEEHLRMLAHWLDIRAQRPLPHRRDLDPAAFHRTLRHAGLIDVVWPAPRFRYRLVGTELERRFHQPLAGHFVEEVKRADYADYLCGLYRTCAVRRAPLFVTERSTFLADLPLSCFRLLLPLAGDGGTVDAILYSTISDTDVQLSLARPVGSHGPAEPFRARVLADRPTVSCQNWPQARGSGR